MVKKPNPAIIKQLILAKKLLKHSHELVDIDRMENNLMAIFGLNSALNIILKLFGEQEKIKSIKQLNSGMLEREWETLSNRYRNRYNQELSMKTQIFTIDKIMHNIFENNEYPSHHQVIELAQALNIFLEDFVGRVFDLELTNLDFHVLVENSQVKNLLTKAIIALDRDEYSNVLKMTVEAYQIALEDQRQKLNFLLENGLLKPELLMLGQPVNIHIQPSDEDFIHMILHTDIKKLNRFKQLVPTAIITEDENNQPQIVISDFVSDSVDSKENANFCLDFTVDTILRWESCDLMKIGL